MGIRGSRVEKGVGSYVTTRDIENDRDKEVIRREGIRARGIGREDVLGRIESDAIESRDPKTSGGPDLRTGKSNRFLSRFG